MATKHYQNDLVERWTDGKMKVEVRIVQSNQGRYIAQYKLGTTRFDIPTSGATAIEAMENAKRWLKTPIYSR